MKMNNKGFSFVELLVVMAIMMIGITTAFNVFAYQNNTNARKISENIMQEFNQLRTDSMAYAAAWEARIHVKTDSDGKTYFQVFKQETDPTTGELMFDGSGNPVFDYDNPHHELSLGSEIYQSQLVVGSNVSNMTFYSDEADDFHFSFKKSTGGVDKITVGGSYIEALSSGSSYATLTIKTDSGKVSTIKIYFITGRVEVI